MNRWVGKKRRGKGGGGGGGGGGRGGGGRTIREPLEHGAIREEALVEKAEELGTELLVVHRGAHGGFNVDVHVLGILAVFVARRGTAGGCWWVGGWGLVLVGWGGDATKTTGGEAEEAAGMHARVYRGREGAFRGV